MKKNFTLTLALFASMGIANAQGKMMQINLSDGTYVDCYATNTDSITYKEDKWVLIGTGQYTEAALAEHATNLFGKNYVTTVTYDVEIEENTEQPGVYRLVNPYGEAYPYNQPGDWDDTKDYYLEIDASNPTRVFFYDQNTGLDWGSGRGPFYLSNVAGHKLQTNEYEIVGRKEDSLDNSANADFPQCGTLSNGVISFPRYSVQLWFPEDTNVTTPLRTFYQITTTSGFKVVLPK